MKRIVNLFQLIIVAAIIYPVIYIWDTDKVEDFCEQIKPGMPQEKLLSLAEAGGIKLIGPELINPLGAQWKIIAPARTSFSGFACEIQGATHSVAFARIIRDE